MTWWKEHAMLVFNTCWQGMEHVCHWYIQFQLTLWTAYYLLSVIACMGCITKISGCVAQFSGCVAQFFLKLQNTLCSIYSNPEWHSPCKKWIRALATCELICVASLRGFRAHAISITCDHVNTNTMISSKLSNVNDNPGNRAKVAIESLHHITCCYTTKMCSRVMTPVLYASLWLTKNSTNTKIQMVKDETHWCYFKTLEALKHLTILVLQRWAAHITQLLKCPAKPGIHAEPNKWGHFSRFIHIFTYQSAWNPPTGLQLCTPCESSLKDHRTCAAGLVALQWMGQDIHYLNVSCRSKLTSLITTDNMAGKSGDAMRVSTTKLKVVCEVCSSRANLNSTC